jgi:sugar phosphate isomerase/epimerase
MELLRRYLHPSCALALFDIGWAHVPGGDPCTLIEELGPRIGGFHFRNHRGSIPTETLSEGDMDVAAVAQSIKALDYAGWVSLELWHRDDTGATRSMLECQRESMALLRTLLG